MAEPEPEPEPEPLLELDYDHTVEGILVTVGVSSALYVIILIGVTVAWVRASHKPRDASKSDTPEETALEAWRRHFFGGSCASVLAWPVRLALLSDNTVETLVGRQPVAFLRFQRHLRVVLFVYTVLINGLILPVNLTGGNWEANPRNGTSEEDSGIGFWQQDRLMYITSASNVQTNDVPRLLAYLGVMVFVAGFSLANLGPRALVGRLLSRRQAQQAQFEPLLEHYSVMIRRFPRELDGEALQTTLEPLFPTEVVDVYVHSGSAFITFRTNRTARRFIASYTRLSKKWRWCRCRCTSSKDDVDKDRHATEATGVEWSADGGRKRRESALVLSELDVVDFPPDMVEMLAMRKWKLRWAPPAKDLVWAKLDVHWCGRAVRWWIMTACLMTFIILTVLTVTVTTKLLEFADLFFDKVLLFDTSSALYTQYLPVLLALTINAGIVPALIETQAETEGHYLVSNISQACLRKQCAFLCLAVVILPSLALESSRDLAFAIYEHLNPEEVIDLIGREVLNVSGPYFIRYILQAAIVGTSVNMLLIQPSFFKLLDWCCRGGRGEIVWQFPYEYHYAICCCIFCVSVASGMVFPPLMPVGLLYFVLKTLSDKFVLLFGRANVSTRKLPEDEAIIRSLTGICAAFLGFATIVFTLIVVGFFAVKEQTSNRWMPIVGLRRLGPIALSGALIFLLTVAVAVQYWYREPPATQTSLPAEHPPFSLRKQYRPPPEKAYRPSWADVLRGTMNEALLPGPRSDLVENGFPRPLST